MKDPIITIPVHSANNNDVRSHLPIEDEVRRIAAISYDSFIEDRDALSVAIYASHPSVCAKLLQLSKGDSCSWAAGAANALNLDPTMVTRLAADGYFETQLRTLLGVAKKDPDHGAKLVQVFLSMLDHRQEHRMSKALVADLQRFLAMRWLLDGFALVEQNDDECLVLLTEWWR